MEEQELLERALSEINYLRNSNQIMKARLDMFDAVMSALHGRPAEQRDGLMAPDIAYELSKKIAQLKEA